MAHVGVILRTCPGRGSGERQAPAAARHPPPGRRAHLHLARRRRPSFSRELGDTLSEGEAFKRRIDDQLAVGSFRPTSTLNFAAYAAAWIKVVPLEEQTRYRYRSLLRRHVLQAFGPVPLAKIHPHLVRTRVAGAVAGPLSASSVRQSIAVLRSCLKAARIEGHPEMLPLLGVRLPRSHSRQPTVLTLARRSR